MFQSANRCCQSVVRGSILLALMLGLSSCSKPSLEQTFLETVNTQLIRPTYTSLAHESKKLAELTQLCETPANRNSLKDQWRTSMTAWQKAQSIQFGPIREHNLAWEFQFWPDKKNLIAKKLKPLLKAANLQNQESLKSASVVTHGLPAMEYLLFDDSVNQRGNLQAQCELVQLIGDNIADTSELLDAQWQQYQTQLLNANVDNPEYPNADHAVAVVIDSFLTQVEQMSSRKLTMALGLKIKSQRLNPYFLESWRSQHSKENLQANLSSVETLLAQGGFHHYLSQKGHAELAESITNNLLQTQVTLDEMSSSLFEQLSAQDDTASQSVQSGLATLTRQFKIDIPAALNIQLGFNNNDGD